MSGQKDEALFRILRIYDEPEETSNVPQSSDISSQSHQAQSQPEGVYGMPPQAPGFLTPRGPLYQETSAGIPQQWVLQTLGRSELQASCLPQAEPEAAAELAPR